MFVIYLIIYCIQGSIWGWAVKKIIENKGYSENWFWWGFFFGLFALIVALTKPDLPSTTSDTTSYFGEGDPIVRRNYAFDVPGGWRCTHCGRVNAGYVGTCGCGYEKSRSMPVKEPEQIPQKSTEVQTQKPQMLFCTSCGKQMEAEHKFCRYCGAKAGTY